MVDHEDLEVDFFQLTIENTTNGKGPCTREGYDDTHVLVRITLWFLYTISIKLYFFLLIRFAHCDHDDTAEANEDASDFNQTDTLLQKQAREDGYPEWVGLKDDPRRTDREKSYRPVHECKRDLACHRPNDEVFQQLLGKAFERILLPDAHLDCSKPSDP